MHRLWTLKLRGDLEALGEYIIECGSDTPSWFLWGSTVLEECCSNPDEFYMALWAEGPFSAPENMPGVTLERDAPLLPQDKVLVLQQAAIAALRIVVLPNNYNDLGETLLRKHPNCRKADTPEEAIISAALQERQENFTDEDYTA